jgi:hypothetical protein
MAVNGLKWTSAFSVSFAKISPVPPRLKRVCEGRKSSICWTSFGGQPYFHRNQHAEMVMSPSEMRGCFSASESRRSLTLRSCPASRRIVLECIGYANLVRTQEKKASDRLT